jgi:hypothetical protein
MVNQSYIRLNELEYVLRLIDMPHEEPGTDLIAGLDTPLGREFD